MGKYFSKSKSNTVFPIDNNVSIFDAGWQSIELNSMNLCFKDFEIDNYGKFKEFSKGNGKLLIF